MMLSLPAILMFSEFPPILFYIFTLPPESCSSYISLITAFTFLRSGIFTTPRFFQSLSDRSAKSSSSLINSALRLSITCYNCSFSTPDFLATLVINLSLNWSFSWLSPTCFFSYFVSSAMGLTQFAYWLDWDCACYSWGDSDVEISWGSLWSCKIFSLITSSGMSSKRASSFAANSCCATTFASVSFFASRSCASFLKASSCS